MSHTTDPWEIKTIRDDDKQVHDHIIVFDGVVVAIVNIRVYKGLEKTVVSITKGATIHGLHEHNRNWLDVIIESVVQLDEYTGYEHVSMPVVELLSLMKAVVHKADIDKSDVIESATKLIPPYLIEKRRSVRDLIEIIVQEDQENGQ